MGVEKLTAHIESTPGVCAGKPRIAGRRITVQNIAVWHEKLGLSPDEIVAEHDLTLADVHAALAYYFDHREEIERAIADDASFAAALRERTPSQLTKRLGRENAIGAD